MGERRSAIPVLGSITGHSNSFANVSGPYRSADSWYLAWLSNPVIPSAARDLRRSRMGESNYFATSLSIFGVQKGKGAILW
jgi:hypothetical protein